MITDLTEYHRNYYYPRRAKLIAYLGDSCFHCGATDSLEFDHIDPAEKSFNIASNLTLSNPEVRAELDKCQLLCGPCHRRKTAQENSERQGVTHGGWYAWQTMKCTCPECEAAKRSFYDRRNAARRSSISPRGPYGRDAMCGEYVSYKRGCRCQECKEANSAYMRALRSRKKPA